MAKVNDRPSWEKQLRHAAGHPNTPPLTAEMLTRAIHEIDVLRENVDHLEHVAAQRDRVIIALRSIATLDTVAMRDGGQSVGDQAIHIARSTLDGLDDAHDEAGSDDLTEEDWARAKKHFDSRREQYQELEGRPGVNTTLALRITFDPLAKRFNAGERTRELYDAMLSVE